MNRRALVAAMGALPLASLSGREAGAKELPSYWTSRLSDVDQAVGQVKKGRVRMLTRSAGGRPIHVVSHGEAVARRPAANYNSACGGSDPASYAHKDGMQRPVVLLLGPVHGAEFEGLVGLIHLLRIAETGADGRGRPWRALAANLARCRVLIVPSANPDGRARCPYDSWVGEDLATAERVGMGTRPDGSPYAWPDVKRVHPMRGAAVGTLGAYFNDDGVNLMHDEWSEPMAAETRAFFNLAREEAPDWIASLHSHASLPSIEPTAYVPRTVKESIRRLGDRVRRRYAEAGLPHGAGGPTPREDGERFPPPSFNLCSALHHACGAAAFVFESCRGVATRPHPATTHEQILDLHLLLFDELFRLAVEGPVRWTK